MERQEVTPATPAHTLLASTTHMVTSLLRRLGTGFCVHRGRRASTGDGAVCHLHWVGSGKLVLLQRKKSLVPLGKPSQGQRKKQGFSRGARGFTEQCPRPLSLPGGCTVESVARNGLSCQAKLPAGHN